MQNLDDLASLLNGLPLNQSFSIGEAQLAELADPDGDPVEALKERLAEGSFTYRRHFGRGLEVTRVPPPVETMEEREALVIAERSDISARQKAYTAWEAKTRNPTEKAKAKKWADTMGAYAMTLPRPV